MNYSNELQEKWEREHGQQVNIDVKDCVPHWGMDKTAVDRLPPGHSRLKVHCEISLAKSGPLVHDQMVLEEMQDLAYPDQEAGYSPHS
jgi:hypothetical protein